MQQNDDAIIAKGLLSIRQGILDGNWQLVVQGYGDISDEHLPIPSAKPKSRLDNIRTMLKVQPPQEDFSTKTVKELKEILTGRGYTTKDFKGKNKAHLISLLESSDEPAETVELSEDLLRIEKIKGGTRFGNKGEGVVEIFSDPYDEQEALRNKKLAKPRLKPKERTTQLKEIKGENASFRYFDGAKPRE